MLHWLQHQSSVLSLDPPGGVRWGEVLLLPDKCIIIMYYFFKFIFSDLISHHSVEYDGIYGFLVVGFNWIELNLHFSLRVSSLYTQHPGLHRGEPPSP